MKKQEYSLFIYRKDAQGNWYKQEVSLAEFINLVQARQLRD